MRKRPTYSGWRVLRSDNGQALPWMVLLMVLFLGMAGLTLDLGRAYACYRELQGSTDAAALAAANELARPGASAASVQAVGLAYSSQTGGANVNANLAGTIATVTPACLKTLADEGIACASSSAGNNAVVVTQTVTIPTFFIQALKVFGLNSATSLSMGSRATAAMHGGYNDQYNIAILIDTTPSMSQADNTCTGYSTKIACALGGVRTLLQDISPCTAATSDPKSTCVPFDSVSLFTFPAIQAQTTSSDTDCRSSTTPAYTNYTTPVPGEDWSASGWSAPQGIQGTYQITNYLSNFSSTNAAGGALSTSSLLSKAAGVGNGCGLATEGFSNSHLTYFAGAIYAAQSSLMAAQKNNSGTKNAMIILTDGDANNAKITTTGTPYNPGDTLIATKNNGETKPFTYTVKYPNSGSNGNNCQQAIDAATFAKYQGTEIYTVAYAAETSNTCQTDTSGPLKGLSGCDTVKDMATDAAHFYSDDAGSGGSCSATTNKGLDSLSEIFGNIANNTRKARLIPNGTT